MEVFYLEPGDQRVIVEDLLSTAYRLTDGRVISVLPSSDGALGSGDVTKPFGFQWLEHELCDGDRGQGMQG